MSSKRSMNSEILTPSKQGVLDVCNKGITSKFIYIVILTWLSVGVDFGILMLVLNAEREITMKGEIGLFNSMMAGEPLYLTGTKIDEGRD